MKVQIAVCLLLMMVSLSCHELNNQSMETVHQEISDPQAEIMRILPVGDSRVEGWISHFYSYRYTLWKMLVEEERNPLFIGNRVSGGTYPSVNGVAFSPRHLGKAGATTADLVLLLDTLELVAGPDVVLLGIGINDMNQGVEVRQMLIHLNRCLAVLRRKFPKAYIFVEKVAPGRSDKMSGTLSDRYAAYEAALPSFSDSIQRADERIFWVDMARDWEDRYMSDALHYNETGANEVASRYFEAIVREAGP